MQRRTAIAGAFVVLAFAATNAAGQTAQNTIGIEGPATPYDALLESADAAYRADDLERAVALLEQAIALDPRRLAAYNNLGVAELDRGQYERAADRFLELAFLVRALPAGDADAAQYYVQAHDGLLEAAGLLLDEGAAAAAQPILTGLLGLYPESDDARHNLALAWFDLGRWGDLLEVGRQIVANEPLSDAGWSFMMDAHLSMAEEAVTDAEHAEHSQRYDDVHAQAEALPFRLDALRVDPDAGTISGAMFGGAAPAAEPVRLRIRFIGRDGVVDERTLTLHAPGTGVQTTFTTPGPRVHATGWTYTLAE